MSPRHRQRRLRWRLLSPRRRGDALRPASAGSTRRLFAVYAVVSLVPVLLLGALLMRVMNAQTNSQGLSEGRSQASAIARNSIAPALNGHDLRTGLQPDERQSLAASVALVIRDGDVLRLRVRNLDGAVVFADDGSTGPADDEALDAAAGQVVSHITYLNDDEGDAGPRGPRVVEVYQPLKSIQTGARIGVLEVYIPYAPIAAEIAHGQRVFAATLSVGLVVLWLFLLLVSGSVTGRLRRQAALNAFLASHDTLTGLPNRAQFAKRATAAIAGATAQRCTVLALIDLDRFREVNDTLGHANGDRLLIMLAERLTAQLRPKDTVARLGGDEFGLVLTALPDATEAIDLLGRIRGLLGEPLEVDGVPLAVEASVGYVIAPDDGSDVDLLLQRADVAMYAAKRQHLGVARYRPSDELYDSATLTLVAELGAAIEHNELVVHYQPKGSVRAGRVIAVEALVRWQHPTRGLLFPDSFVPAAEQTELVEHLTRWVLHSALTTLPTLDPKGELAVAVNISARSLVRPEFAGDVLYIVAASGVDPRRVILELTETALMTDPVRATRTLARLSAAGLRISIDDFGAGQTSLGYLATLPISELKIDKAFVLSMLADHRNAAIVRSVIELGHSLGFTVTAEGVETVDALERLTQYGCDTVQGYLLSRPVSAADLAARMRDVDGVLDANAARMFDRPGLPRR